ncbi:MAG: fumarylacetoacetate hydrolase family protein [Ignavibacteria bacterium]|jgi:5-carboxymethyl-2-hydroxymuconate isomerase|nr:fumarylacetoacetate hydrolase family protein [Ignavibacteria bacterium]MDH7528881.1 fumarylacetoacetate hydrolase family protein [Ignavibacteria bacterium]
MKKVFVKGSTNEFIVGKIACIGKNYLEHAKELGDAVPEKPVIFLKPSSSIIFSGDKIVYPEFSKSLHYETELVLLIGKTGKKIPESDALNYIAGYTVGLDMTLRDLQSEAKKLGHPWTISKCFDTSTVLGEFTPANQVENPNSLDIKLWVNGELKQSDNTSNMIFSVEEIVEYLSYYFTLEEGDLVFTGTPKGVGEVKVGDKLVAEISNVGRLETEVIR